MEGIPLFYLSNPPLFPYPTSMAKAVELLIRSLLPDDVKDSLTGFDDKSINNMLVTLYQKHPDKYKDISHKIATVGREASYKQGESIGLKDLVPVIDKGVIFKAMDAEIKEAKKTFRNDPDEFNRQREAIWYKYNDLLIKDTMSAAKAQFNNLGMAVSSGSRGKPVQVQAMLSTPGVYQDANGKTIPVFIRNSFAEGLRPYEYMAGTYGARSSVISTKVATAKGGDFGKLASQTAANLVITDKDCHTNNGISYEVDDSTVRNRVLARDTGGMKAGTLLDRQALAALKKQGVEKVIARSPLSCKADGLCSKCVGMTFEHRFPKIGEHVGITAANALCLAEGTKVLMGDSTWKNIEEIKVGDTVVGYNHNNTFSPTKVTAVHDRGNQSCNKYVFTTYSQEKETTVVATENHRWHASVYDCRNKLVTSEESTLKDVPINKQGARFRKGLTVASTHWEPQDSIHENLAFILGAMLGDGTFDAGGSATFSCYDPILVRQLNDYLQEKGMQLSGPKALEAQQGTFTILNNGANARVYKNFLKTRATELGLWGSRCKDKHIPDEVFSRWDHSSVCAFLAGLIVTDGYIGKEGEVIKFTNSSEQLADDVFRLIKNRLLIPGVFKTEYNRKGVKEWDIRTRNTNGIFRLGSYLLPYMLGVKKFALDEMLRKLKAIRSLRDIAFLKQVNPAGNLPTWDITVDNESHLFVTEGLLITHNSEPVTQGALCLAEGTMVRMWDGSEKAIEKIRIGDIVLGSDKLGRTGPVEVTDKFNQGEQPVQTWDFANVNGKSFSVECTANHKFLNEKIVYNDGKQVELGERITRTLRNDGQGFPSKIVTMYGLTQAVRATIPMYKQCWDIEVANPDHLFVLANGMIVSNSAKHTAGQGKAKRTYGGFEILSQFVQSPSEYQHKSTVAEEDGIVTEVREAPQGGHFVKVNEKELYVPQGYPVLVKQGDEVEAGDALSEGIVDVRDVVNYKGLGEARRYYVDRLKEIYADSGLSADKKNLEIFAKGALSTVNLDEEMEDLDNLPDDSISYNKASRAWKPKSIIDVSTDNAIPSGYLAGDVLHHTSGTRITKSMLKDLKNNGVTNFKATEEKPPFTARMDRLRTASHANEDWLASMSTSYLSQQLADSAVRGAETNFAENQHFAPRLGYGVGFGEKINQTGKF